MIKLFLLLLLVILTNAEVNGQNKEFLTFLEDFVQPILDQNSTFTNDIINSTPASDKRLISFIRGFVDGTKIIDFLPSIETCRPFDDDLMYLVDKFFNTLKNITIHNIEEMIQKSIEIGYDILDQAKISLKGCPKFRDEFLSVLRFIDNYVSQKGYLEKILIHGMVNRAEIIKQIQVIRKYVMQKDDFNGGRVGGKLFVYIFFYDADIKND